MLQRQMKWVDVEKAHLKERIQIQKNCSLCQYNVLLINYGCSWLSKLPVIIMDSCPSLTPKSCRL